MTSSPLFQHLKTVLLCFVLFNSFTTLFNNVVNVDAAPIDFYYPQWQALSEQPADQYPWGRHGQTCTRADIDLSTLPTSIYDPSASDFETSTIWPSPAPPAGSVVDSVICFGGSSRQSVPDGYILPESGNVVIGPNQFHTYILNDITLFDISRERWYGVNIRNATQRRYDEPPFVRGDPDGRVGATSAIHQGRLIVWGGSTPLYIMDNSALVFNFATGAWSETQFDNNTSPHVRTWHSGVYYDKYMYVFGGYWYIPDLPYGHPATPNPPPYFNDLWRLDLETLVWTQLSPGGTLPTKRGFHNAVVTSEGVMYIWGGDGLGPCSGDSSRLCPGATTFENEVWSIDLTAEGTAGFKWNSYIVPKNTRATNNVYPQYREFAAVALSAQEDFFVVTGGTASNFFFGDIYKFHLATQSWELVPAAYPAADARYGQFIVPLLNGTDSDPDSKNPDVINDLFLMISGRRFTYTDVSTYGVLFTGGYVQVDPPEGLIEGSTDTIIISFDRRSPQQKLIPKDKCGNRIESSALSLAFASMTERAQPGNSLIQQVDFLHSYYAVNATALVAFDPTIGFSLNNSVGLSVDFDFQLFGDDTLVNYGNTSFKVPQSTNKWSFNIGGWRFLDLENTLEIDVELSLENSRTFDKLFKTAITSEKRVKYTLISSEADISVSIFISTFALRSEAANPGVFEEVEVGHRIEFQPGIAVPSVIIVLPSFTGTLYYDPDFGVSLDVDKASACQDDNTFDDWKIAVIVLSVTVPCIACCIVVIGVAIYLVLMRRKRQQVNDMEMIDFEVTDSTRPVKPSDINF